MKEMNLAAVLISKRREKGVTQEELAAHVGVSKQSVSKWENGNSYPDIVLLPQLASYFNISVDELIGYEPQMTVDDIRKLNMELLSDFATKPFEEVMNRCRDIIKKYFSCFPLLFQIGSLYVNYGSVTKDDEQKACILSEAKELFIRVKNSSNNVELKQLALHSEAVCEMIIGNANNVVTLLENEKRYTPQPSIGAMLSQSYQVLGKAKEAKATLQEGILDSMISLLYDMPSYLAICTDDVSHFDEICRRTIILIELFNAKKLSPISILPFYLTAADGYVTIRNTEKALDMLEAYTEVATGDIFPLVVKGDNFFTLIDEIHNKQLNERPFGMPEIPRDEQSVRLEITNTVISHPAFFALHENQRFQNLIQKLKEEQK